MLEISFRKTGSVVILDLAGNIDIDSANFVEKVGWCIENGYYDILCNFDGINLVDYAGLSVLAIAYKNVLNHKGTIKFLSVPEHIKKIFCLVALDRVFDFYNDEKQAIKSFKDDKNITEVQKKQLRRRFKRLPLDMDVQFKSKRESDFHKGKILNLSAVGMLIFADKIYPLGEIVDLKAALLPKPGQLEIEARVAWHVQKELQPQIYPGMGLEFHGMNSEKQKKLLEFVERNLPSACAP